MLVMSLRNDCSRRGLRDDLGQTVPRLNKTQAKKRRIFAKLFSGA